MLGSMAEGPEAPVLPGETLAGKYRIERVIGHGGMGVVVAARHLQLDERVAIKFLKVDGGDRSRLQERFLNEARAAAKIRGEHVVRIFDIAALDNGSPYIVMEFLEGRDLASVLSAEGRIPIASAVDFVLQAGEAISEAHRQGIVHRDLKPENLFLTTRPDGGACIKVLDFGISKSGTLRLTATSAVMGSPIYMPPEQLASARDVDERADVWSLGVTLFELVCGQHPFMAETLPQLLVAVRDSPPLRLREAFPGAPQALEDIILRCLEKNPDNRFQNLAELARTIAPLGSDQARVSADRIARVLASGDTNATNSGELALAAPVSHASPISPSAQAGTGLAWQNPGPPRGSSGRVIVLALVGFVLVASAAAVFAIRFVQNRPIASLLLRLLRRRVHSRRAWCLRRHLRRPYLRRRPLRRFLRRLRRVLRLGAATPGRVRVQYRRPSLEQYSCPTIGSPRRRRIERRRGRAPHVRVRTRTSPKGG